MKRWAQTSQKGPKEYYRHLKFMQRRGGHRYSKMNLKGFTDIYSSYSEGVGTDIPKMNLKSFTDIYSSYREGVGTNTPHGPKEYRQLQFIQRRGEHRYSKWT